LEWHHRVLANVRGDPSPEFIAVLIRAGHLAQTLNDPKARSYLEKGLLLARAAGDVPQRTEATFLLGIMAEDNGDYEEAERLLECARELARQTALHWLHACVHYHLGVVAYGRGDLARARVILEEAREMGRAIEDMLIPTWTGAYLALIACEEGDLHHAGTLIRQGWALQSTSSLVRSNSILISAAAVLAAELGEWGIAARLLGLTTVEHHDVPYALPERTALLAAEQVARERLGSDAYAQAWNTGHQMRRDVVVTEVERMLAIADAMDVGGPMGESLSVLTPREREVLRLLIEGKSNRDIAEVLFISPRTATTHVTNILAKFGVETRAAAVTYAFQHDLA
jgi:non-specific serine/threonine protein kinase